MKRTFAIITACLFSFFPGLHADEGMWLLPLLEKLNIQSMNEMGLELTAEDIYSINQASLKDAIVIFGGGCTGEMVSSDGLLFTNHHCGRGAIHYHSTVEHDYLHDGFWAMTREEELHTPGLSVTFLVKLEKVTDRIMQGLKNRMTEKERRETIDTLSRQIADEATSGTHYRATVSAFSGGNEYYLLVYESFNDVRLVGAPPASIGNYGADTDNWMWPRHTGDFSIFRVYIGPDGKPAGYSPDNIPMKPRHYLPVSNRGVEKGDFAMVLGYPGGTTRYMTSYGIDEVQNITHPNRIKIRGIRQELMLGDMLADREVMTKYRAKYSGSTNYWKFSIGQSGGVERLNVRADKEALEERFSKWANANRKRSNTCGEALELIRSSIEARAGYTHANQYLVECLIRGSEIIGRAYAANRLYSMLQENENNKEAVEHEIVQLRTQAADFFRNYNPPTDLKITAAMLKLFYEDVPSLHHPAYFGVIKEHYGKDFERFTRELFEQSVFADKEKFFAFLDNPLAETLASDPAFLLAGSVFAKNNDLRELSSAYDLNLARGRRLYIAGLSEMDPSLVPYPDANFSMRLTYGTVQDYSPRDAVIYKHFTTIKGVLEKEDPANWEFVLPEKLKQLSEAKDFGRYAGKDGNMPVCFITNNDITGGNSGSPVINGKGELIGLAFDGSWEAMSGDIAFEPGLQRCIAVDIRYVLFIIDKFAGASHLIEELDIR